MSGNVLKKYKRMSKLPGRFDKQIELEEKKIMTEIRNSLDRTSYRITAEERT